MENEDRHLCEPGSVHIINKENMFNRCTCKRELPESEEGALRLRTKIGFFASSLLFARWFTWPSRVCKECAEDTNTVGELGLLVTAAVLALGLVSLLVAKHFH
jgi:hypothetical protein